jgi:hypothetical protein
VPPGGAASRAAFRAIRLGGFLAGIALAAPADPPPLEIPSRDPAFADLRRIEARSGVLLPGQSFPQPIRPARAWLESRALTPWDSARLLARFPFATVGEAVRWDDSARGNLFLLSPLAEAAGEAGTAGDTSPDLGRMALGARIYGTVGGRLGWYTHALAYTEWADRELWSHQFDPENGETYSVEKGAGDVLLAMRTYNRFEYYLRYDQDWWSIKAGRDHLHAGPGYFSSLTATRETPPYYQAAAHIDFAPWLALDDIVLKMTDSSYDVQKYANLHRFTFRPSASVQFGYEDLVIYQDRDPDPAYLLPFVPLTFSEANSGGRDNASMAFDAVWAAPGGLMLWGQLFLDDLLGPTSIYDDFWENRWAGLAGFQWVLPSAWADADLVFEYSHVEPWTYNGRETHTSFKHYDVASASKLGPDSRSLDAQASWRFMRNWQARAHWEWDTKGTGRPGTLGTIHDNAIDGQTKEWLKDARSTWRSTQEISWFFRRYAEARIWWTETWGSDNGRRFGAEMRTGW